MTEMSSCSTWVLSWCVQWSPVEQAFVFARDFVWQRLRSMVLFHPVPQMTTHHVDLHSWSECQHSTIIGVKFWHMVCSQLGFSAQWVERLVMIADFANSIDRQFSRPLMIGWADGIDLPCALGRSWSEVNCARSPPWYNYINAKDKDEY